MERAENYAENYVKGYEKGYEEGITIATKLIQILLNEGRAEDLMKLVDTDYRNMLLKKYNLVGDSNDC